MRQLLRRKHLPTLKNSKRRNYAMLNRKAFITVEAAIFLPIFIVGVLTYAYLIKFMAIQEAVFHAFTDEAKILSSEAGINPLNAPFYELKLKDRIFDDHGDLISSVCLERFKYLYHSRGQSGMISMDLNYDINIRLPIQFYKSLPISESLMLRGFVGKTEKLDPQPYEEMEQTKKSELVWIFPRAGEKYHHEDCITITSEPRQMIMNNKIRRNYDPCTICDSSSLVNGSLTYCFRTGSSFHTGKCPIVDKYVISVEKEEAEKRGYHACLKCRGD